MDEQRCVNLIVGRLLASFRALAQGRNMVHHVGGVEWLMSSLPGGIERTFNVQLSDSNAQDEIRQLVDLIERHKAPNTVITTPLSTPRNIGEVLIGNGFLLADESNWAYGTAMNLQGKSLDVNWPDSISVKSVDSFAVFREWMQILNAGMFEAELMKSEDFGSWFENRDTRFFMSFFEDVPAGVAMSFSDGETVDINFVATLAEYRRRGVATAAIITALSEAQGRGMRTATLSGEDSAMPLYEKIGFRKYFPIRLYEYKPLNQ